MFLSREQVLAVFNRRVAAIASILAFVAMVLAAAPSQAATTYNKYKGPNYTSRIILTYDDCPKTLTAYKSVLATAKQYNIGLVIAPYGNCITSFKSRYGVDITVLARQYGQYVINHSVTHANLTTLSYSGVLKELSAPGVVTNFGRPPYGATNTTVNNAYAAKNMKVWLWTKDTRDWSGPKTQAQVVSYVVTYSVPGDTVLMHLQHAGFNSSAILQMRSGLLNKGRYLCRAYRGTDNAGSIITAPQYLPASLPC